MTFERHHKSLLFNRLTNESRQFIQVIYGPRQVGKTTLIRQILDDLSIPYHYATADYIPSDRNSWISLQWEIARNRIKQEKSKDGLLVLDEIQKLENWSEIIKKEWDYDTFHRIDLKVVLLGSSRLLIQKGLTESLAGRFETIYMEHWSFSEMEEAFDLDVNQFIWFGGYPGAVSLIKDEKRWKQYVIDSLIETSISRDVLQLTRVDKPALLRNLFDVGCRYSSQIQSFTKIIGQLQDAGNSTTLSHYLQLLDSAGLLGGIEKFSPSAIRQRSSSPKFLVHNTALMSALYSSEMKNTLFQPAVWGRWVESSVGAHLLNHMKSGGYNLFYWRERNDEMDFVIEKNKKIIGIEVKSGSGIVKKGADQFRNKFSPEKIILTGKEGMPVEYFLKTNPEELF
jgi:predicted AAA+ superfamily ATPase